MSIPLSTWAIRNPIPPIILFLVLTIGGLIAFKLLAINNMPNIVVPVVQVEVLQPGATATEIESQVTQKVESALTSLQGIKHISSSISEGRSVTSVEFQLDTNFDQAVNDARDEIANIRADLPASIQDPTVTRVEIEGGAILIYSVEAPEMTPKELSWFIDDYLNRELLSIRGVAAVQRQGGIEHEITLNLNENRLAALGISAADISRQLALTNIDLPSGRITLAGTEYSLRTLGSSKTVDLLGDIRIALPSGAQVKLSDLGILTDGAAQPRSITRLDGKPAVTFEVYRSKGSSEISLAQAVQAKLTEINKKNPGVYFKEIFSLVTLTQNSFSSTVHTFFEGAVLTVLVVFFFLQDKRATLIAALAIPLSIIPTFLCMYWLGFTLNTISLLAISLVTGVLVDDAIVEIENIHRHMKQGKTVYDAAMVASDEIGLAVVATTLVICAVFVPVSFMDGIPGQFFKQFGLTVAIAAFFSLLVARIITPMLAAYLLKPLPEKTKTEPAWLKHYQHLVEWTLNNRAKTLIIALSSMLLSFAMIPFLSTGFLPYEDYAQSRLTVELPRGATVTQTDAAAQKVTEILRNYPEVLYVLTHTGGESQGKSKPGLVSGHAINKANIEVKLVPADKRKLGQREFENMILPILQQLPDMKINFTNASGTKDLSIALVSDEGALLEATASAVESEMRMLNHLTSVNSSISLKQPEIIITPDFAKASTVGVNVQAISDAISIATIGDIAANLAKFNYGNRQIPIRVRFPENHSDTLAILENIKIPTIQGGSVPLSAIASITFSAGPATIERYDRERRVTLEANLNGIALGEALEEIYALPTMKNLPQAVNVRNTKDAETMAELFNSFAIAIIIGLLLVYSIQVLLYKDWLQPFTRMVALPLSIGGTFFVLLISGTELGMPAIIGILLLMGIADKNAILLVDYMLDCMQKGMTRRAAVLEACRVRARPIIMTSFAMFAGMVPIALGLGLDSAFRAPMAIAVIGGLISSTALSLIFVPILFCYMCDFEEWLFPKLKRLIE